MAPMAMSRPRSQRGQACIFDICPCCCGTTVVISSSPATPLEDFLQSSTKPHGALIDNAPIWDMQAWAGIILAGAADGLFLSDDRGRSWTRSRAGIPPGAPGISFLAEPDLLLAAVHLPRTGTNSAP